MPLPQSHGPVMVTGTAWSSAIWLQPHLGCHQRCLAAGTPDKSQSQAWPTRVFFSTFSPLCPTTLMVALAQGSLVSCRSPRTLPLALHRPARSLRRGLQGAGWRSSGAEPQCGNSCLFMGDKHEPIHQALGTSRANEILLLSPYLQHGGPLPKRACVKRVFKR